MKGLAVQAEGDWSLLIAHNDQGYVQLPSYLGVLKDHVLSFE